MAQAARKLTMAQQIAYSRGRCAKVNGESKSSCPYLETSPWREFWMEGHENSQAADRKE